MKKPSNATQNSLSLSVMLKRGERLRVEMTHLLSLISDFLSYSSNQNNDSILSTVSTYMYDTLKFLMEPDNITEWEFQSLRFHYAKAIENMYMAISITKDLSTSRSFNPTAWVATPFDTISKIFISDFRVSVFRLLEQWCGVGKFSTTFTEKLNRSLLSGMETVKDIRERNSVISIGNEQKRSLQFASLQAMSALCKGPINSNSDSDSNSSSLYLDNVLAWINDVIATNDDSLLNICLPSIYSILLYNS
jgi:hypothetical protein